MQVRPETESPLRFNIASPHSRTAAEEIRGVKVVHPLTGAWFSPGSVMCPPVALPTASSGSAWVPCSFAIRARIATAAALPAYDTWVRVWAEKQLVLQAVVRVGMDTVQIPVSLDRVAQKDGLSGGPGWYTLTVEVCAKKGGGDGSLGSALSSSDRQANAQVRQAPGFGCEDAALAEVEVEVLDAAEATARPRDVRTWCDFCPLPLPRMCVLGKDISIWFLVCFLVLRQAYCFL
jgi:hypothetical protein